MSFQHQKSFSSRLQLLVGHLQKKQYQQVIDGAKQLSNQYANQSDVLHLMALAYKGLSHYELAVDSFKECLRVKPSQFEVLNNLGNCYSSMEQLNEAIGVYEKALSIKPDFVDALKNIALIYSKQERFDVAEKNLKKALDIDNRNVSVHTQLGNLYKEQEKYDKAIAHYKSAIALNPRYINAIHNLGLAYKMSEKLDEALQCFDQARQINPNFSEIDYNAANTHFEKGQYQLAEKHYWSALNKNPSAIDVHTTLNEFYWQTGRKDAFGHSFKLALESMPDNLDMHYAYVDALLTSSNLKLAETALERAFKFERTPNLLKARAILSSRQNDNQAAIGFFEASLEKQFDIDVALDLISVLIVEYEYDKALALIKRAEVIAPLHQLLIAYKATLWRLTGDDRYEWLIDYQKFVAPYQIPAPNGYASLSSFMEELEHVLLSMHKLVHEPLKQTLKNGTQTPGRLLYKPHPVIQSLKASLTEVVQEHIASLPTDTKHPLLSRKSNNFQFAGSWSVKLKPEGFHVNHVHPAGWLSSAFYVNVPDFSKVAQKNKLAGSIKFGESSLLLGEREKIERIIEPRAGTLALFPSYVWHGTIPFSGGEDDYRLTSPFDVIPVK